MTLTDAMQVLWSVDSDAPYDSHRAARDLADLCPRLSKERHLIEMAEQACALAPLRTCDVQGAHMPLLNAGWKWPQIREFLLAYISLETNSTRAENARMFVEYEDHRTLQIEESFHQGAATRPSPVTFDANGVMHTTQNTIRCTPDTEKHATVRPPSDGELRNNRENAKRRLQMICIGVAAILVLVTFIAMTSGNTETVESTSTTIYLASCN